VGGRRTGTGGLTKESTVGETDKETVCKGSDKDDVKQSTTENLAVKERLHVGDDGTDRARKDMTKLSQGMNRKKRNGKDSGTGRVEGEGERKRELSLCQQDRM